MRHLFFVLFTCFVMAATANAQELFRCTDADGNDVITTSPQEGMKCKRGEGGDDHSAKRSRKSSSTNLVDICSDLTRELDDVNDDISTLEKRRTELQREQLDQRKSEPQDYYSSSRRRSGRYAPESEKMSGLSREMSLLQQKRMLINQDIRSYKCNELNSDLTKLNQKRYDTGSRYRNR